MNARVPSAVRIAERPFFIATAKVQHFPHPPKNFNIFSTLEELDKLNSLQGAGEPIERTAQSLSHLTIFAGLHFSGTS